MSIKTIFISSVLFLSSNMQLQAAELPKCVTSHYPNKTIRTQQIVFDAPEIAERGDIVPVRIDKILGMPTGVYVREVSLFSEYRKEPLARFEFHNHTSPEQLKTRIRIPNDSRLFAVAVLSDGQVISGERAVKVTIGGCGGGDAAGVQVPKVSC